MPIIYLLLAIYIIYFRYHQLQINKCRYSIKYIRTSVDYFYSKLDERRKCYGEYLLCRSENIFLNGTMSGRKTLQRSRILRMVIWLGRWRTFWVRKKVGNRKHYSTNIMAKCEELAEFLEVTQAAISNV